MHGIFSIKKLMIYKKVRVWIPANWRGKEAHAEDWEYISLFAA